MSLTQNVYPIDLDMKDCFTWTMTFQVFLATFADLNAPEFQSRRRDSIIKYTDAYFVLDGRGSILQSHDKAWRFEWNVLLEELDSTLHL